MVVSDIVEDLHVAIVAHLAVVVELALIWHRWVRVVSTVHVVAVHVAGEVARNSDSHVFDTRGCWERWGGEWTRRKEFRLRVQNFRVLRVERRCIIRGRKRRDSFACVSRRGSKTT